MENKGWNAIKIHGNERGEGSNQPGPDSFENGHPHPPQSTLEKMMQKRKKLKEERRIVKIKVKMIFFPNFIFDMFKFGHFSLL